MDNISHFRSLDELIRALDRERKLLHALFQDRKRLSFRYDLARELASKRDESIEFLRRNGIIRENADFVELENELDGTYKVTAAFHYIEELIDCLTIIETEEA